jgi:hypothetical protein
MHTELQKQESPIRIQWEDSTEADDVDFVLPPDEKDVLQYIGGYLARTFARKLDCQTCRDFLCSGSAEKSLYLREKEWDPARPALCTPSKVLMDMLQQWEILFRRHIEKLVHHKVRVILLIMSTKSHEFSINTTYFVKYSNKACH